MAIDILRSIFCIIVLLGICYMLSAKRSHINWRIVLSGIGLQIALAVLILKVPFFSLIFDYIAGFFTQILSYSDAGAQFLFGDLVGDMDRFGMIFAFRVLPTIIFFSALTSSLYYFGILQIIIKGVAWVMNKTMGLSGAESLAAAANVFIGQTEAPLVVKPYIQKMTQSELLCLMTGGMATIAGSVFTAFVGYLGGDDPEMQAYFAKHLLTASIMSAPAAIVASKMLFPEDKNHVAPKEIEIHESRASNILDAISTGTTDGLKLAVNVGAMLLVFTALIFMANEILMSSIGDWTGLNEWIQEHTNNRFEGLSFTYILGLIFAPFAWLLGTPNVDVVVIGQLLGQKTVINEFVAYAELNELKNNGILLQPKSLIIATYALCGFSNFASIGIQIGGISAIAPGQRENLTRFGLKALIGGTVACFLTAAIAGVIY